jgi:hypothetical protein
MRKKVQIAVDRRKFLRGSAFLAAVGLKRADAQQVKYLPAVSRRLHHGHDLGEPFDFLTWFEYSPEDANAFEGLVRRLRQTAEWRYVDREVDIRLSRI